MTGSLALDELQLEALGVAMGSDLCESTLLEPVRGYNELS